MPLIDDRGRLFGRVNLIDGLVGVLVLGLIPLAYGAFLLFKTPAPKITSIQPAEIIQGETKEVRVLGSDLRPFLRARVGDAEAKGFLVLSPTEGEIRLPDNIALGSLDVGLFDDAQELLKMPGALTVVPKPPPPVPQTRNMQVLVVGALIGVRADLKGAFRVGTEFAPHEDDSASEKPKPAAPARPKGPVAVVLAERAAEPDIQRIRTGSNAYVNASVVGTWRIPSILKLTCLEGGEYCRVNDVQVQQGSMIRLPWARARTAADVPPADPARPSWINEEIKFQIDEVRPVDAALTFPVVRTALATIQVRFMAPPEVANRFKVGDLDFFEPLPASDSERAALVAVSAEREPVNAMQQIDTSTRRNFQIPQTVVLFNATVRVPVVARLDNWTYKDRPIKVGAPFSFEGPGAASAGWIQDVTIGRITERRLP